MNSTPDLLHAVAQNRVAELRCEAQTVRLFRAAALPRPVLPRTVLPRTVRLTLHLPWTRWTLRVTLSPG